MKTIRPGFAPCALALLLLAAPALADEGDWHGEAREAYRHGYDKGYQDGFAAGYRRAQEEARVAVPVPAPPPQPPARGPIEVTGATYGTAQHNCNATRYVARRANGRLDYSFEVSNEMCGDPAHGDRKQLQVTYYCGDIVKSASAAEHRTVYLDCRS